MDDPLIDTIEFRVIGELKGDPGHLLLVGDDGRWYDYAIGLGTFEPIEPSDCWAVDVTDRASLGFDVPAPNIA